VIGFRDLVLRTDWEWVSRVISPILCADTCGIVATTEKGEIVGAAIYDSFTVSSANIHLAVLQPTILRRGFLHAVAGDIFIRRGRSRIFGLTPENNKRAIKFNRHIGMREVARIPDAYDEGVGYVITRMDRADSPWLAHNEEAA